MNNLDVKLNELEDKVVSERLRKADLKKRVELREKKIHSRPKDASPAYLFFIRVRVRVSDPVSL